MTLIDDAKKAILDLTDLTEGFAHGYPPDPVSVMGFQSKIVRLHALLGEEMSKKFGAKESEYLARKIRQAEEHEHGRLVLKMTSKDSEERAFRSVRQHYEQEIRRMEEFELCRTLLRSLLTAFEHSRSVVSFLRRQEEHSSDPQP